MRDCTVRSSQRLTPNSVLVTLDPGSDSQWLESEPGQRITCCLNLSGQNCYRSYNLVNAPGEAPQIAVKQVSEAGASKYFNTQLRSGDVLRVAQPEGDFYNAELDKTAHHLLMFAAGSGITPLLSIIQHALTVRPDNKVTLFYANSEPKQIMFRERLDDLAGSSRLNVFHILGNGATGEDLSSGRLNPGKVQQLLTQFRQKTLPEQAFISGPDGFREAVEDGIQSELRPLNSTAYSFSSPTSQTTSETTQEQHTEVHLTVGGVMRVIPKASQSLTLLDAADQAGLDMPADCRSGICHRCKARIVLGRTTPAMRKEESGQTKPVEPGFILCCQEKPNGERLELEMD